MQVLKQKITEFFTVTLWRGGEDYFMVALSGTPVVVLGNSFQPDPAASLLLDDGTDPDEGNRAFLDGASWLESKEFKAVALLVQEEEDCGRKVPWDLFVESYQEYAVAGSREANALSDREQMAAMETLPTFGMF